MDEDVLITFQNIENRVTHVNLFNMQSKFSYVEYWLLNNIEIYYILTY